MIVVGILSLLSAALLQVYLKGQSIVVDKYKVGEAHSILVKSGKIINCSLSEYNLYNIGDQFSRAYEDPHGFLPRLFLYGIVLLIASIFIKDEKVTFTPSTNS